MTEPKLSVFDVLKNLLDFIEENNITDEEADDGGGHTDTWRSTQFDRLIKEATETLDSYRHLPYPPSEEIVKRFGS